jgi:hypothetical protein
MNHVPSTVRHVLLEPLSAKVEFTATPAHHTINMPKPNMIDQLSVLFNFSFVRATQRAFTHGNATSTYFLLLPQLPSSWHANQWASTPPSASI